MKSDPEARRLRAQLDAEIVTAFETLAISRALLRWPGLTPEAHDRIAAGIARVSLTLTSCGHHETSEECGEW